MSLKQVITSVIKIVKVLFLEDRIIRNKANSHVIEGIENQLDDEKHELEEKVSQEEKRRIFYNYAILYKTKLPDDIKKGQELDRE